jgi:hypothetical protein
VEIKNLNIGDHFVKWDGKLCRLETLNECRARIFVYGGVVDIEYNTADGKHVAFKANRSNLINVSPETEVLRVVNESDPVLKEQGQIGAATITHTRRGTMEKQESPKLLAFSKSLPTDFVKEFKGKEYKIHRVGENRWEVNNRNAVGIREAMNAILEAHGGNNGRTADHFFHCGLVEKEPKTEKKAAAPKAEKKAKMKKTAKKAKNGKADLKFSKSKQTASKPKKSLSEMAKELTKTEAA